jgi:hypothetical protein
VRLIRTSFESSYCNAAHLGGRLPIAVLLLTLVAQPGSAEVFMTASEVGGDVIITYSGMLNLSVSMQANTNLRWTFS